MLYTSDVVALSVDDKKPFFNKAKFDAAVEHVYKSGGYKSAMLEDEPLKELVGEIADVLTGAYDSVITTSDIPPAMDSYLRNDLLYFSGFKSHAELQEVAQMLRTDDGRVKPFEQFTRDVAKVHTDYNVNYLNAEYNFAISSAQMAAKWVEVEADGDRYNLQYRTSDDARVRDTHLALHNITLPPSDPFWDKYYPPNGWGCRCTTAQVRKSKYETSDPEKALADGLESTRQISNGIDKGAIFRFNPGKLRKIIPPKHPYYKVPDSDKKEIKKTVENIIKTNKTVNLNEIVKGKNITQEEFKNIMQTYASKFKENYNGGLLEVNIKNSSRAFMSNGRSLVRSGNCLTLYNHNFKLGQGVTFNPFRDTKDAFQAIRGGKSLSFNQEYAMESLWHETLHAKALGWKDRSLRNDRTIMHMETINQFVARHTYPQFIESFAGKASNQKQIIEKGYGYGGYVDNFRELLKYHKIKESEMVDAISDKLFNEPYENVGASTIKFLESKGVKNALDCMNSLDVVSKEFVTVLNLNQ